MKTIGEMKKIWQWTGLVIGSMVFPLAAFAGSLTPGTYSATIDVGETIVIEKTVTVDDPPKNKVDIFFLADNTGSMGGVINAVKNSATALLSGLSSSIVDVQFGVGRYLGDPKELGETPLSAYQLQQSMTTSASSVQTAINGWFASGGGDGPEANFFALHQVATEGGTTDGLGLTDPGIATGQVTGWRDDAARIIVWFGDVQSHTTTVDQAEAIAALVGNGVTVAALNTRWADGGIDGYGQASSIVAATGGTLVNNVSTTSAAAVLAAILGAIETVTTEIDLTLITTGDTSGLDISFTCTSSVGCDGVPGGATRTFDMSITGLTAGTYDFTTSAVGVVGAVESDSITVRGDEPPPVSVPEPASLLLMGIGLLGIGFARKRRAG